MDDRDNNPNVRLAVIEHSLKSIERRVGRIEIAIIALGGAAIVVVVRHLLIATGLPT